MYQFSSLFMSRTEYVYPCVVHMHVLYSVSTVMPYKSFQVLPNKFRSHTSIFKCLMNHYSLSQP